MTDRSAITVHLDPVNPGQFFACCGLLELADRLWQGAEGWFSERGRRFHLRVAEDAPDGKKFDLMDALAGCQLENNFTPAQRQRYAALGAVKKSALSASDEKEKKEFESLRREAPLVLGAPFHLQLDWWGDDRSGGSRFKTWAGQQSVVDIAQAMKEPLGDGLLRGVAPSEWFLKTGGEGLPFNFDSDLGPQSAALDVGFSLDPLGIRTPTRPLIELGALIGLQRFRPWSDPTNKVKNRYRYVPWSEPLLPLAAFVAAMGIVPSAGSVTYEFPLLYRTKYLKSFLPAQPLRGES